MKRIYLLFVFVALTACGYQFAGGEGILNGTVHSVHVQMFENKSRWSDIDVIFTNDIISELLRSRSVSLNDTSDVTRLLGTIERVHVDTLNRSADGRPQEKYIEVTLSVYLKDKNGKKIWQSQPLKTRESYFPGETHQNTLNIQMDAIKRISKRVAMTMVNELGQGF